jgi:hypothetical protein
VRSLEVGGYERFEGSLGKLRELIGLRGIRSHLLRANLTDSGAECLMLLARPIDIGKISHIWSLFGGSSLNRGCERIPVPRQQGRLLDRALDVHKGT